MSYRFEIEVGKSKRFPVGGKYCDGDIIVTAVGGSVVPDEPVAPEYSEGLEFGYDDNWFWYAVTGYGTWDGEDLVIPPFTPEGDTVEGIDYGALDNNTKIKSATLPDSMTWIADDIFKNCPKLTHLYMPYITSIASITMSGSSFEYVQLRDIAEIGGYAFHYCNHCVFDFTDCSAIPTLDSYGAGEEFGTDPLILVPKNLLEEWKQATNWALYADYIAVKGQENAQEKTIDITENGSYEVIPDEGKLLRKVTANVAVEQRSKSYDITLAKTSGWVLLTTLAEEVLGHINDESFVATFVNMSPYSYESYAGDMYIATNTPHGYNGKYPVYGLATRLNSETSMNMGPIYYPANNTGTSDGLGGNGVFHIENGKYYIKPGDGFIRAGNYKLTFTW